MLRRVIFWAGVLCAAPSAVDAAGTAAGTVIQNTATLTYSIGGGPQQSATTPPAAFTVAELINVTLVWQDAANVAVGSPDSNRALTFLVTNTGNGPETFSLARNNAVAGDNYDPANGSAGAIFLESGLQPGFQASGPNADVLACCRQQRSCARGRREPHRLRRQRHAGCSCYRQRRPSRASSFCSDDTRCGRRSTGHHARRPRPWRRRCGRRRNARAGSTNRRLHRQRRRGQRRQVRGQRVDPAGGPRCDRARSSLIASCCRSTAAAQRQSLALDDPLPVNTSYVSNSITINGAARTDAVDTDSAEFSSGAVKVRFGDTAAPVSHTVEFRVTVN